MNNIESLERRMAKYRKQQTEKQKEKDRDDKEQVKIFRKIAEQFYACAVLSELQAYQLEEK